ncbi:hypothetical protein P879_00990 [Paragonimus westermani]|uniref:Kinesin motor domain-containing protein n=1 Tax=Paragonimus westermani TaxID=34504 RepID=A0A8T0E073_9TREM|nr:hypothetical protein P879_00990 [Paragonimus westermani]
MRSTCCQKPHGAKPTGKIGNTLLEYRAFDHIFETISVSQNTKFLVHASFLEIYNEEIRDLLAHDVKTKLDLKEHPDKGVYVAGLSMHKVTSVQECQVSVLLLSFPCSFL